MELIVTAGDRQETLTIEPRPAGGYEIRLGETRYLVDEATAPSGVRSLLVRGIDGDGEAGASQRQWEADVRRGEEDRFTVASSGPRTATDLTVMDPLTHRAREALAAGGPTGPHRATAYMPGRVITLLVEEGAQVEAGQGILVLEAMKMENEIAAESGGVVRNIFVQPGQAVDSGDPLFEIE